MKLRQGFVSNSSTSSFLIYGVCIEDDHIIKDGKRYMGRDKENPDPKAVSDALYDLGLKVVKEKIFNRQKEIEKRGKSWTDPDNVDLEEVYEMIVGDLECEVPPSEYYFIGRSWSNVKDDQTGAEFRKEIEDILKPYFPHEECGTHEDAWRDG